MPGQSVQRLCLSICGVFACALSAHAQVAGSVSLSSSEMFRGETISGSTPALTIGASFDHSSGIYAGMSATVTVAGSEPRLAALLQYAGYARRMGPVTAEVGVIHRSYDRIVDTSYRRGFFEGFAGAGYRGIKARAYISSDYLVDGRASYYLEINARLFRVEKWTVEGHGGLSLIPHDRGTGQRGLRNFQDWRLQASRPLGRLLVAFGVNATNYPVYSSSGRAKVYASISHAF